MWNLIYELNAVHEVAAVGDLLPQYILGPSVCSPEQRNRDLVAGDCTNSEYIRMQLYGTVLTCWPYYTPDYLLPHVS